MKELLRHIVDRIAGKIPAGSKRSGHWPTIRKEHLKKNPVCAVCGGDKMLEVHHKLPFHLDPTLELNPVNLITLCESKDNGINCHLGVGHLGNFKSYNRDIEKDEAEWNQKIKNRPLE
jgi:5-methylcytosine-specific restriction endonuclease McrA